MYQLEATQAWQIRSTMFELELGTACCPSCWLSAIRALARTRRSLASLRSCGFLRWRA